MILDGACDGGARVIDIESIDSGEDGRHIYAWLRLSDGRGALWNFDLARPPGQAQSFNVIEGA